MAFSPIRRKLLKNKAASTEKKRSKVTIFLRVFLTPRKNAETKIPKNKVVALCKIFNVEITII